MSTLYRAQILLESEQHQALAPVSYTHLRAHETPEQLVCRLLLEKKKTSRKSQRPQDDGFHKHRCRDTQRG